MMYLICLICYTIVDKYKQTFGNKKNLVFTSFIVGFRTIKLQKTTKHCSIQTDFSLINLQC
jgi:hypothetical protein